MLHSCLPMPVRVFTSFLQNEFPGSEAFLFPWFLAEGRTGVVLQITFSSFNLLSCFAGLDIEIFSAQVAERFNPSFVSCLF